MKMKIDELIMFCGEKEYNHRVTCKRYDDASGYTRSKDKNIRTPEAITEETHADFYREIADTMRKYQKIEQILKDIPYGGEATVRRIQEVVNNGNDE